MFKLSTAAVGLLCLADAVSAYVPAARSIEHSTILERADQIDSEYDYIIVGGGTSGLTVADRLTESGKYSVLVLELGHFQNGTSVTTVSGGISAIFDPTLYFLFPSVPQSGLNNRTIGVVGGVMLGGSSGVNGMQVMRGQKEDYDRWGSYFGPNTEWSWDGLLPYFKKAWNFHPPSPQLTRENNIKYDTRYWGNTSNVHASFPSFLWPFIKTQVAAFGDLPGVEYAPDSGSGKPGVIWWPTSSTPSVLRSFARPGHWDGVETRSNYHTLVDQKVLKVLFQGKKATGVLFVPVGSTDLSQSRTVKAKKEIILAAGTIHTPQILQASGVGPKDILEAAGVPVVVDLPGVGSNFQDHPFSVGANFNLSKFDIHPDPTDLQTNQTFIALAEAEFAANRTGPLSVGVTNAGAFLPFPVIAPATFKSIADRYEAQDPAAYLPRGTPPTVIAGYQAQKKGLAKLLRSRGASVYNVIMRGTFTVENVVYLHPLSRGTVHINTTDPYFAQPLVDYRALSNPADLDVLVEFLSFTRKLFLETRLNAYGPFELVPGANVTARADILASLRDNMNPSTFHPIGTSSMLPLELGGVVDQKLLVYGVKGLSVVDASTFPDLIGAYTQQTTYAVAEKVSRIATFRKLNCEC
ncbi:GMC oxidoreductase-like protein [Cercophora scortea]|uniref:GMC oxidoreductase-like protein n=1 Tax=Cercophora scortea TaxID=314031 RepID=A0AAE0M3D9_9PEZI|nr:GMC oxidoreductase-like protein [Cercophora scortea]